MGSFYVGLYRNTMKQADIFTAVKTVVKGYVCFGGVFVRIDTVNLALLPQSVYVTFSTY